MSFARLALGAMLLQAMGPVAHAAVFRRARTGSGRRSASIARRKRLHVNTLITEPGEMEVEFGGAASVDGGFTLPSTIKYTPEGSHAYWGRTEFSASFDT